MATYKSPLLAPSRSARMRGALLIAALATACTAGGARAPTPVPKLGVDTFVSLKRTPCFGRCPVYTVTLFEDGRVLYEGQEDAPPGPEWRRIAPAEVTRIMDAVLRIEPWTCKEGRTDQPGAIITLSRGGKAREVVHDYGDPCAPAALRRLEDEIDVAGGHPNPEP